MSKTVLITGASGGIGRETAKQFALLGDNVLINYSKNAAAAAALEDEIYALTGFRHNLLSFKADVSNRDEVLLMHDFLKNSFGPVDVLVNNAGIACQKLFSDITSEDWDTMFNVNVKGMFNCIQSVLPDMINRKSGKIINISSIWGITGASCEVHYSASKAAVIGLTKSLAKELGPCGIQVNCIAPGIIDTAMNSNLSEHDLAMITAGIPLGSIGSPANIANIIVFMASPGADYLTGQVISPNGGMVV